MVKKAGQSGFVDTGNSRQILKTAFFPSILLFDTRISHRQLGLFKLTGHKTLFYKNVDTGINQSGLFLRIIPDFYVSTFFTIRDS